MAAQEIPQEILEVTLVKKALLELLKEQLFTNINEFASKEKYIQWQLSKIFVFPITIVIDVIGKSGEFTATFKANGEVQEITVFIN